MRRSEGSEGALGKFPEGSSPTPPQGLLWHFIGVSALVNSDFYSAQTIQD